MEEVGRTNVKNSLMMQKDLKSPNTEKSIKVSVDYDGCFEFENIQDYIKELIEKGLEVHLVTTRYEDPFKYKSRSDCATIHDQLFKDCERVGIQKENIHFTDFIYKYVFFKDNPGFLWHLDDNLEEFYEFRKYDCDVRGIDCLCGDFRYYCNKMINEKIENGK